MSEDGFLGRWSKRKLDVKQGKAVQKEPAPEQSAALPRAPSVSSAEVVEVAESAPEQPPPPTLEEAQALTPQSDFRRFAAADVAPDVKNAALKKLFADPRYNVMDGLDVYIDDYSKPDPMPYAMVRQLASAKFLNLFREEEEQEERERLAREGKAPTGREVADVPAPESVAQSSTDTEQALPPAEDHAHPDLRLQQDDAPGPEGPGAGSR